MAVKSGRGADALGPQFGLLLAVDDYRIAPGALEPYQRRQQRARVQKLLARFKQDHALRFRGGSGEEVGPIMGIDQKRPQQQAREKHGFSVSRADAQIEPVKAAGPFVDAQPAE